MDTIQHDLTKGSVGKLLLKFAAPFLVANLMQSLFGIVDMAVAGAFIGSMGLSALAVSSQITNALGALIFGFSAGGTILVAQYVGAKRHNELVSVIGTMFTSFLVLSVFFTAGMLAISTPLLRLLNTPEESFAGASAYLNTCLWGTFFIFGFSAISAVLRGMGDSKRPMYFSVIAVLLNIVLALLFVGKFNMGTGGAALATVISQGVSFVLAILVLMRSRFIFDFKLKSFKVHMDKLRLMVSLGLPGGIQQVLVQCSFLVLTSLINTFGVSASAVSGIGAKFNGLAILPSLAMMTAVSTMAGQNIGAGRPDRAESSMKMGVKLILPVVALIMLIVNLFPRFILGMFTNDPSDIAIGIHYMRISSIEYLIDVFVFCINGMIQGAGYPKIVMVNAIVTSVALRVPLAYLFSMGFGMDLYGVALATSTSPFGGLIIAYVFYRSGVWRKSGIVDAPVEPELDAGPEPEPEIEAELEPEPEPINS